MNEIMGALGSALVLSLLTYGTKWQKGEPFDVVKLIRTLIIGAVLGIIAKLSGAELTADNWTAYELGNAGIIALIDQLVKLIGRLIGRLIVR